VQVRADVRVAAEVTTPFPLNRGQTPSEVKEMYQEVLTSQHLFLLIEFKGVSLTF